MVQLRRQYMVEHLTKRSHHIFVNLLLCWPQLLLMLLRSGQMVMECGNGHVEFLILWELELWVMVPLVLPKPTRFIFWILKDPQKCGSFIWCHSWRRVGDSNPRGDFWSPYRISNPAPSATWVTHHVIVDCMKTFHMSKFLLGTR